MSQIIVSTFDVPELSIAALNILNAAVRHAYKNQRVKLHTMKIDELCHLAHLPTIATKRFSVLLKEARKALVVVELIDTSLPERDDLPYSSWPVFNKVRVKDSTVSFEVCSHTFEDVVLASLPAPVAVRAI